MKSEFNKYLLSFCLMFFCAISFAQKDIPPPAPPPPPGLPIDGGITFLLISGITYGVYELKRKK